MLILAAALSATTIGQAQQIYATLKPGWYVRPPGIIEYAGDEPRLFSKLECEVVARAVSYAENLDDRSSYCSYLTEPILP